MATDARGSLVITPIFFAMGAAKKKGEATEETPVG